jgi:hypothetical protein
MGAREKESGLMPCNAVGIGESLIAPLEGFVATMLQLLIEELGVCALTLFWQHGL